MFRLVREIGLEQDDRVASRIARAARRIAAQCVDGRGIADLAATEHGEWHDLVIWLERCRGGVGAPVVVHQYLVFARLLLKHLAKAPEQQPDGLGFVISRNANVEHGIPYEREAVAPQKVR